VIYLILHNVALTQHVFDNGIFTHFLLL